MAETETLPEKRRVRAAFEASAASYDAVAVLQREVADRLLERLDLVRLQPASVLDVGSGTGYCSAALARRYPVARLLAVDLAHAMACRTRERFTWWQRRRRGHGFICADAESLPLADASCDLIISNLTLQWCGDLARTFAEFRRVLRPGGLLMFSTLGPDTLKELRAAWAAVDDRVHVNRFVDMHDVGDALLQARFADPVMDMEMITMTYPEAMGLMRDLKGLGAHNVNPGRNSGLTGRRRLQAVAAAYEPFRRDGVLPASYEVVYGHAWVPEGTPQQTQQDGEARIRLDQLRGTLKGRGA